MSYNPKQIANYYINKSRETNVPITPMQLIKMVYIAHGWNLAINKSPLINEPVQAWKYGPVIPSLYHQLKYYGNCPITNPIPFEGCGHCQNHLPTELLDAVWDAYHRFSGPQLSTMTHYKGTPWDTTTATYRKNGCIPSCLPIPDELINDYYNQKAEEAKGAKE